MTASEKPRTVTLSDGGIWTKLDYPPGYWSMTRDGRSGAPIFCSAPFVISIGGFTASDHRAIADILDPPKAIWLTEQELSDCATMLDRDCTPYGIAKHIQTTLRYRLTGETYSEQWIAK